MEKKYCWYEFMCSQYYYIHSASQTLRNHGKITSVMQTSCIKGEVSTMDRLKNSQTSDRSKCLNQIGGSIMKAFA